MALTPEEIQKITDTIGDKVVAKVSESLPDVITKAVEAKLPDALKDALEKNEVIKNLKATQDELQKKVDKLVKTNDDDTDDDVPNFDEMSKDELIQFVKDGKLDTKKAEKKDNAEKLTKELAAIIKRIDLLEKTPDASTQSDEDIAAAAIKKQKEIDDSDLTPAEKAVEKTRKILDGTHFSVAGLVRAEQ